MNKSSEENNRPGKACAFCGEGVVCQHGKCNACENCPWCNVEYHEDQDARPEAAYYRPLPDGREIAVYPRFFNSIIVIGPQGSGFYDQHW